MVEFSQTLPHHSPSFPSCRPSNGMAQRQRDSHLCCDLSDLRRNTWVFDCPWFDCGFINSHGCYPLLATLTYLKFQLDAHMHLAGEDVDMLETPLQHLCYPWRPFSEPILRSAIQNGSQTRGVRNAAGLKFCELSEERPNPACGCSCMWLYLFMYIIYT